MAISEVQVFGAMAEELENIARMLVRYRIFEKTYLAGPQSETQLAMMEALVRLYAEMLAFLSTAVDFYREKSILRILKSPFRCMDEVRSRALDERGQEVNAFANLSDAETLRLCQKIDFKRSLTGYAWPLITITTNSLINLASTALANDFSNMKTRAGKFDMAKLSVTQRVRIILEIAEQEPMTIVVDGLDSIDQAERPAVIGALPELVGNADNVVKVFITSRSTNRSGSKPAAEFEIEITSEDTKEYMEAFVDHLVEKSVKEKVLLEGDLHLDTQKMLKDALLSGSHQMFLWARLQVERICRETVEADVVAALRDNLPQDLDLLYQESLGYISHAGEAARDLAIKVISCILYIREPLRPRALLMALGAGKESALDLTQVLESLRFSHQSVQGFLIRHAEFSPAAAHRVLASLCIGACLRGLDPASIASLQIPSDNFYVYAAMYWAVHSKLSLTFGEDTTIEERVESDVTTFIFDEEWDTTLSFESWIENALQIASLLPREHVMKRSMCAVSSSDFEFLLTLSMFGLGGVLRRALANIRDVNINLPNDSGHTSIYLAAALGQSATLSLLVESGATINVKCGTHGSPLHAACFYGHLEVVKNLLHHGADVSCGPVYGTAFEAACRGRREDIAIYLLEAGLSVADGRDDEKALRALPLSDAVALATLFNHKSTIKLLLDIVQTLLGVGVEATVSLYLACCPKKLKILDPLFHASLEITSPEDILDKVFSVKNLDESVVQMVLSYEPLAMTVTKQQFLEIFALGLSFSFKAITKQKRFDINSWDEVTYDHPLQVAIRLQKSKSLLTFDHGPGGMCCTFSTASWGRPNVEKCESTCISEPEMLSLHFHGQRSSPSPEDISKCQTIVELLLRHGADIEESGRLGPPLHLACIIGCPTLVRFLLERRRSNHDGTAGYFANPLFTAIKSQQEEVFSVILQHFPQTDYIHSDLGTALHFACSFTRGFAARALLQNGADATAVDGKGRTPLTIALETELQREKTTGSGLRSSAKQWPEETALEAMTQLASSLIMSRKSRELGRKTLKLLIERFGFGQITEQMAQVVQGESDLATLPRSKTLILQKNISCMEQLLSYSQEFSITGEVLLRSLELKKEVYRDLRKNHSGKRLKKAPSTSIPRITLLKRQHSNTNSVISKPPHTVSPSEPARENLIRTLLRWNAGISITQDMLKVVCHAEDAKMLL
ncbi:hypothetical protein CSAL01_08533 [Colletotrichum salicis]|uniref:DUF7708 domain-containing protein n=1 Tax=Colletotrichum salicis TaxID=1209931 RepID=A0A135V862_9PEZI|nr:hypothetical protein CSAL01_08533 [Colletotrichum salicis]